MKKKNKEPNCSQAIRVCGKIWWGDGAGEGEMEQGEGETGGFRWEGICRKCSDSGLTRPLVLLLTCICHRNRLMAFWVGAQPAVTVVSHKSRLIITNNYHRLLSFLRFLSSTFPVTPFSCAIQQQQQQQQRSCAGNASSSSLSSSSKWMEKGAHYKAPFSQHCRNATISQGIQSITGSNSTVGHHISRGFGRSEWRCGQLHFRRCSSFITKYTGECIVKLFSIQFH